MKNLIISMALCSIFSITASELTTITSAFKQKKYPEVLSLFENFPENATGRHEAGLYAAMALFKQNKNHESLELIEQLIKNSTEDRAWQCRFKLLKMTVLAEMNQPQKSLEVLTPENVPPAFLGEFYCMQGKLLNQSGKWRQGIEAFYYGTRVMNDFAGRAQLLTADTYKANQLPLPAIESYLKVLSMRHSSMNDRRTAVQAAAGLLDNLDLGNEEVDDVLKNYPYELKLTNAEKLLLKGRKLQADLILNEIISEQRIPLPMRELATAMKN